MAGRPKIFNEQKAIEKASTLFWIKGYEATSTEDLIKTMGLQRGSFYHSFGSKKELFVLALNLHETASLESLRKALDESPKPIELLKSIFYDLANCLTEEHKKGCFSGNTIAELSNIDEDLVLKANKHLKTLESIFYNQIKKSQKTGELKTKTDAQILALYLLNLWNGINITRRIYPSKTILCSLIEIQLEILK